MKRLMLLLLPILFFAHCNNDDLPDTGFEMQYLRDFEIFAGLNTLETHIFQFTQISSEFDNFVTVNGYQAENVQQIVPKAFRLTNLTGNIPFDDLDRIRLFITKEDGSLESEIAFLEPVPNSVGFQVDLVPTLAQVQEHLQDERFNLELKLNYRSVPAQSVDARLTIIFQAVTDN